MYPSNIKQPHRGPFQPFKNIEEYRESFERASKNSLLKEASQTIAWGYPDNESTGYSHRQLISLISRLKKYIEEH